MGWSRRAFPCGLNEGVAGPASLRFARGLNAICAPTAYKNRVQWRPRLEDRYGSLFRRGAAGGRARCDIEYFTSAIELGGIRALYGTWVVRGLPLGMTKLVSDL